MAANSACSVDRPLNRPFPFSLLLCPYPPRTQDNIKRCDDNTREMLSILDGFNRKISDLEVVMVPIHEETTHLTMAQRNIDSTALEVDQLIQQHGIAMESDVAVSERRIAADYTGYLEWVTHLNVAAAYWSRNVTLKHADRVLKRVKEMLKRAVGECTQEFERLVSTYTRPIDIPKLGWPLPANFELMPAALVGRLSRIAQAVDMSGQSSFLDVFQVHRAT